MIPQQFGKLLDFRLVETFFENIKAFRSYEKDFKFNQLIFLLFSTEITFTCKKKFLKVFKFIQIIFIIQCRNKQRLHVKKIKKSF
jgi:hypothetical protein